MSGHESANPMVTDVFVKGAVQGWNIAVTSTIPNVLMAFVIIKVLNHSGLLTIFGELFAPIMAIFGLPWRSRRRSPRRLDVHGRRRGCCRLAL